MYLKINGNDTKYNVSIKPFQTTNGYSAIRFIGEDIPETDKGFSISRTMISCSATSLITLISIVIT